MNNQNLNFSKTNANKVPEDVKGPIMEHHKQQMLEVEAANISVMKLIETLKIKLSEVEEASTIAIKEKDQITALYAAATESMVHITELKKRTDQVIIDLDNSHTLALKSASEVIETKNQVLTTVDSAVQLLSEIDAYKTTAESKHEEITELYDASLKSFKSTKSLADKAENVEKKLTAYENSIADLMNRSYEQLETISALLPGATAAGLAYAFDERRKKFSEPVVHWQWLFVGSVLCLAILALTGLYSIYKDTEVSGWDELARIWISRLPIAAALVWLALHSSREAALAKRLEEDYGYKAAIAASFLGFQKQMDEIGNSAGDGTPLSQLCQDTLATIGNPPGRIYDKHRLTATPTGELMGVVTDAAKSPKSTE